jgi:hypothetical protein
LPFLPNYSTKHDLCIATNYFIIAIKTKICIKTERYANHIGERNENKIVRSTDPGEHFKDPTEERGTYGVQSYVAPAVAYLNQPSSI